MKYIIKILLLSFLILIVITYQVFAASDESTYQRLLAGENILIKKEYDVESKPTVYLTFDDGPSKNTEDILDILNEEDIDATFFVLGENVEKNEDITKRIINEGHSIGNHTYSHKYEILYNSFNDFWEEIQKTEKIIYDLIGIRTSLVRTPGGTYQNWDSFYFYYMDQAGYQVFDWNVDSGDSLQKDVSTEDIVQNIKKSVLKESLIVLMHDSVGHENTVKALPEIINYYRELGYQFKPITEKVKPIISSTGECLWDRENEYELRDNFVRDSIKFRRIKVYKSNLNCNEPVEAIYLLDNNQLWISLNEIQKLMSLNYFVDNNVNIINIKQGNNLYHLNIGEPFFIFDEDSLIKYESIIKLESDYYIPLKPFINETVSELVWDKNLNFLIFAEK